MTIQSNIRVPGSYNEVDPRGANSALPAFRQPIVVVAPRIKTPASWVATTAYTVGQTVKPTATSNFYYICIVAGTSASTEPTWPGAGGKVTDGTVTWRELCTATEIVPVHTPTKCFSAADGARYAGAGSLAHRIVRAIFRKWQYAEVTLITVDDNESGEKAASTITFSGTATSNGVVTIHIGNDKFQYAYDAGALHTGIATAVDAIIASEHNIAATPSVAAGVVSLRAKNGGTPGNLLGKYNPSTTRYEPVVSITPGTGISVAVSGFTGGDVDPDLESAFDAATAEYYAIVCQPFTGADQLADLRAYLTSVSNEINCKGARAWLGITSSIAAATTLASGINYERIHVAFIRKVKTPAYELAAMAATDHAEIGHGGRPLNYRPLPQCDAPEILDRFEWNELNSLLWNGVAPYNADGSGMVRCVRSITTYIVDATGTPDDKFLDTTSVACLDFSRQAMKARHLKEFSDVSLKDGEHVEGEPSFIVIPADIKSVNIDVCLSLEKAGYQQNVKKHQEQFVSVADPNVAGRVNSDIPTQVIQGLHVLANTFRMVS